MTLGFTGTQHGMTSRQLKAVRRLLYKCDVLHLGDCIGADAQAHEEALHAGARTVGHPPTDSGKRAFLEYDEEHEPKPFLKRDDDIVAEGVDGLIAAPHGFVEERRSGTWATVRRARKAKRCIWIVLPDGNVRKENQ